MQPFESTLQTSLDTLDRQRADAQQAYRRLLERLLSGGKIEEGDHLTLVLAGKSPENLACELKQDIENHVARTADDAAEAEAQPARRELLAPAQEQAAEVTSETRATFESLRLFATELLREFEAERIRAATYAGRVDAYVRELLGRRNMAALAAARQQLAAMNAQRPRATPNFDPDFFAPGGGTTNWSAVARGLDAQTSAQERERLERPFEPLPMPTAPEPYSRRDMAAIVTAAVGKLSPGQTKVIRTLAAALTAGLA